MASISIAFGTDEDVAEKVRKLAEAALTDSGLKERSGVVGPLQHPATGKIELSIWAHDAVAREFHAGMENLFAKNKLCARFKDAIKGLPSQRD